ncbi:MinD/ParA family protein [Acidihalobacter prosperus]|uniref:Flagellar synthesis regulator FleN n=1 Tax=Acidihalobacter prosperus TaxID=160660 RepID=A0A1A6C7E7_9GAMM|nr:MinD/ParA family protein [Acidihalobacter prosperus]OBS10486.1 Flagellar synthesis regulator FleN [Acidihalobacter prosperus]
MSSALPIRAKVIAVTSGKGGVGKTNISVNLAVALASRRRRVCLFDADTNQANVNILLGLRPTLTLEQVLDGRHPIDDILLKAPGNISIVPAASGIANGTDLDETRRERLSEALFSLERDFDYLLVDTAAGASQDVVFFLRAAALVVLVITPEPTSLTNAFSLIRVMRREGVHTPIQVIVNQVADAQEFRAVFRRFKGAVEKYLQCHVDAIGHVVSDETVATAVRIQRPVIFLRYDAPASLCFYELAQQLDHLASDHLPANTGSLAAAVDRASIGTAESRIPVSEPHALGRTRAGDLLSHVVEAVRSTPDLNQDDMAAGIGALISAFIHRFGTLPFPIDRMLYQYLEHNGYPAEPSRSIILTLENLYERHERKPLRDIEASVAKLMADAHEDEARMAALAQHVAQSFKRQFGHPPPLSGSAMIESVALGQHAPQTLRRLQHAIEEALQARAASPVELSAPSQGASE